MVLAVLAVVEAAVAVPAGVFNETQISETNTLKGTIGALKFAGRNETQALKVRLISVC